jgi:tetratricopeptide (TPR) repeat protein/thiol-disulfide isomerase/thioredoxin
MRKLLILLSFIFLTAFLAFAQTEKDAVGVLKNYYVLRDYENGVEAGKVLLEKFPDNSEIQMWQILNMYRAGNPQDAVDFAEKLLIKKPDDNVLQYALASAKSRTRRPAVIKEAIAVVDGLLEKSPQNAEYIFLKISLLGSIAETAKGEEILNANEALLKTKPDYLLKKAELLNLQNKKDESFSLLIEAQKLNPEDVSAFYLQGSWLMRDKRFAEAISPLETAIKLSPNSFQIRSAFWTAIGNNEKNDNTAEKKDKVFADITAFVKTAKTNPKLLLKVSGVLESLKMPDKQKEFEDVLIAKYPVSLETETLLAKRIDKKILQAKFGEIDLSSVAAGPVRIKPLDKIDEKKRLEAVLMCRQFINRPQHFDNNLLIGVYGKFLDIVRDDKSVSTAEILKLADSLSKIQPVTATAGNPTSSNQNNPFSIICGTLNNRNLFVEAEKYARIGLEKLGQKPEIPEEMRLAAASFGDFGSAEKADLLNELGKSLLKQKKIDEAEKELLKSVEISKTYNQAFFLLGELYEGKNELEKAENNYRESYISTPQREPNFDKLKNVYQKRHGNLEGYEVFIGEIKKIQIEKRRQQIVSRRDPLRRDLPAFSLKDLDGKTISSTDLKGKVVLINFWATWCKPCMEEMPEIVALRDKYKENKDFVLLTINSLEDAELVKKFVAEKKFVLPLLLGENYTANNGVLSLPTTWFIDKQGKIAYSNSGYSTAGIFEEFSWKIDELLK